MSVADSTDSNRNSPRGAGVATRRLVTHAVPEGAHVAPAWPTTTTQSLAEETAAPVARPWLSSYRVHQLIAGVVAATLHLTALLAFNDGEPERHAVSAAPEEAYIPLQLPEMEPPETIEVVDVSDAPTAPQLAPPMQMDMPSTVALSDFIQPVRPTVDPALTSVGSITIPTLTAANFGAHGGVRLFDLKELDRTPRRLKTIVPVYPTEMRRARLSGEVVLIVIIDVNGRVEVERVVSATNREFEFAAVKAAEQCQFESPLRGGQRVNARYLWQIPFEIK
jgi:TonB family protein